MTTAALRSTRGRPCTPASSSQTRRLVRGGQALQSAARRLRTVASPPPAANPSRPRPRRAGCLLGKGGTIVKSIRESSGVSMRVQEPEHTPPCALHGVDRVVQCVPPPGLPSPRSPRPPKAPCDAPDQPGTGIARCAPTAGPLLDAPPRPPAQACRGAPAHDPGAPHREQAAAGVPPEGIRGRVVVLRGAAGARGRRGRARGRGRGARRAAAARGRGDGCAPAPSASLAPPRFNLSMCLAALLLLSLGASG